MGIKMKEGDRFGRLVLKVWKGSRWLCKCDCGSFFLTQLELPNSYM